MQTTVLMKRRGLRKQFLPLGLVQEAGSVFSPVCVDSWVPTYWKWMHISWQRFGIEGEERAVSRSEPLLLGGAHTQRFSSIIIKRNLSLVQFHLHMDAHVDEIILCSMCECESVCIYFSHPVWMQYITDLTLLSAVCHGELPHTKVQRSSSCCQWAEREWWHIIEFWQRLCRVDGRAADC